MTDAQNTPIITPVPDPEAGTRIIFLRHGQTDWNIDHRFQGGTDIPLNDTGREQVRTAIGALKQVATEGTTVDAIVSSPLSRAVESAEIVAEGLGVPYRGAIDGFQERSFGDLEGQIATRELILASRQSNNAFNVEPKKDFLARSLAALNRVRREYEGQTVVVAAHLIRHGQTDWNKANLMQGITDIPLNDTGREQARTTGKKLADMGLEFTVLVSSPLSRAYETAQLVGEHFDLQVHKTYPELVERAYGAGEGLDIPAPERRAPERYYPNVESERDVYIRAVRTLRNIVRELSEASGDQKIIAVSHGSFIRRALSAAAGEEWTVTVPNAEPLTIDVPGLFAWDSTKQFDEAGRLVW